MTIARGGSKLTTLVLAFLMLAVPLSTMAPVIATAGATTDDAEAILAVARYESFDDLKDDAFYNDRGLEVLHRAAVSPGLILEGTPSDLDRLETEDPTLLDIETDDGIRYFLSTSSFATKAADVWGEEWWPNPGEVDREDPSPLRIDTDDDGTPDQVVDGTNVTVGVVDTGIDATHPDLWYAPLHNDAMPWEPKVKECTNVPLILQEPDAGNPYCDKGVGHGTHVAGTVAGNGWAARNGLSPTIPADEPPLGMAPNASLVGADVSAGISVPLGYYGLDWMYRNAEEFDIQVVTNSWGNTPGCSNAFPSGSIIDASNALVEDKDIVVLFAAGNYDNSGQTWTSDYASNPTPGIISVANYDDKQIGTRDGSISGGSSDGCAGGGDDGTARIWTFPDVSAPGTGIVSTQSTASATNPLGVLYPDLGDFVWYNSQSGTSMATPHVAGIVALMRQANPDLTAPQIEEILIDTATPWTDSVSSVGQSGTDDWWGADNIGEDGHIDDPSNCLITPSDALAAAQGDASVNQRFPRFTDLVNEGQDPSNFVCRDYRRGAGLVDAYDAVTEAIRFGGGGVGDNPGVTIDEPTEGQSVPQDVIDVAGTVDRDVAQSPIASLSATPSQGKAPLEVSFTIEGSAPLDPIDTWELDFGDGTPPATGDWPPTNPVTHTYTDPGLREAILTLTDTAGNTDTSQVSINVEDEGAGVLWLVGDGSTTYGTDEDQLTNFALSPTDNGGQLTEYTTAGSWNMDSSENPFIPSFIINDPVTLTGDEVTLRTHVDYRLPANGEIVSCPLRAQLMTADGTVLGPAGGVDAVAETGLGAYKEVSWSFVPPAGSYNGLQVQFGTTGVDCGSFAPTFRWGTSAFDGRLILADGDTGGGPGPDDPFIGDASGDASTPFTDLVQVDATDTGTTLEATLHLNDVQPVAAGDSPFQYHLVINGHRFESYVFGGPALWYVDGAEAPQGSTTWDADQDQVEISLDKAYLEDKGITAPYEIFAETYLGEGLLGGQLADDRAPDGGGAATVAFEDATGDSQVPGTDISEGFIHNEDVDTFQVTLGIEDLEAAIPSTAQAAGVALGLETQYSIGFDYPETEENTVTYQVMATTYAIQVDGSLEPQPDATTFELQTVGTDPATGNNWVSVLAGIDGTWDTENNQITWTVPKSEMDVIQAAQTADGTTERGSTNLPEAGKTLSNFDAEVRTWIRAGAGVGPGLTVWDTADGAGETYTFHGGSIPPTADLDASPLTGDPPLAVTFELSASDGNGDETITGWELDFGDGTSPVTGTGLPPATVDHTYDTAGTYTAILTVTDEDGNEAVATQDVGVGAAAFEHVQLALNGGEIGQPVQVDTRQQEQDSWATQIDLSDTPAGSHDLMATWKDDQGQTIATTTTTIVVESTGPTATITQPADGSTVAGSIDVAGTAADDSSTGSGSGGTTTSQLVDLGDTQGLRATTTYDFDEDAEGWTVQNDARDVMGNEVDGTEQIVDSDPTGAVSQWHLTDVQGDSTHWYVGSDATLTYEPGTHSRLVSPVIDTSGSSTGTVSFLVAGDTAAGDQMTVEWTSDTSNNPGGWGTPIHTETRDLIDPDFNPVWTPVSVDLPQAALDAGEIRLQFNFDAQGDPDVVLGYDWGYFVDDVQVETLAEDVTVPGAPTGLTAAPAVEEISLAWDAPADDGGADITAYHVYRDNQVIATVQAPTTTFTDTGLDSAQTYTYTVSAENQLGEGSQSASVTASPDSDGSGTGGQAFGFTQPTDGATDVPPSTSLEGTLKIGDDPEPPEGQVVVSVIDAGFNVYHDAFYNGGPLYGSDQPGISDAVLDSFGIDEAHRVELTRTGDFAADKAADAAIWEAIANDPQALWYFEGTNIIATVGSGNGPPILPEPPSGLSDPNHGTQTVYSALNANPEAIILAVEGTGTASETKAFSHPLVDIVSTSYGPLLSAPLMFPIEGGYGGVLDGKLHFGAADNSPSPAIQDTTAGPWWSIGVSGFEEDTSEGKQLESGSAPDFVADWSQTLPACGQCESGMTTNRGTSFSTPRAAGTASKALLESRRQAGHVGGIDDSVSPPAMVHDPNTGATITNWELRRALEEGAAYKGVMDYDPVEGVFDLSTPVVDEAEYTEIGWGILSPSVVPAVLEQLNGAEPRKSAAACDYMTGIHEARHTYWDVADPFSDSWLEDADPYIHCGQGLAGTSGQPLGPTIFGDELSEPSGDDEDVAPPPYDILGVDVHDDGEFLYATFDMNLILGDDDVAAPDANAAWWDMAFKVNGVEYIIEASGDLLYGDGGAGYTASLWSYDPSGGTTGEGAWVQQTEAQTTFEMNWVNDEFTVGVHLDDISAAAGDTVTNTWASSWPNAFLSYTQPYDLVPDDATHASQGGTTFGGDHTISGDDTDPPPPPADLEVRVNLTGPDGFTDIDDAQATLDETAGTWSLAPSGDLPDGTYTATGRQLEEGQEVAEAEITFTVGSSDTDTTPPTISNVGVSQITHEAATVTWETDEPATSRVDFGTTTSYDRIAQDGDLVTQHQIQLANLEAETTYHFQVSSTDQAGNQASSADDTFTTDQAPEGTVELFLDDSTTPFETLSVDTSDGPADWGPVTLDTTTQPEGPLTIRAVHTTHEGDQGADEIVVTVDNQANVAPTFEDVPSSVTAGEGELIEFTAQATDDHGEDDLTYSVVDALPEGATYRAGQDQVFAWQPSFEQAGDYTVTFRVEDPEGATDEVTVSITVEDVNRAPTFTQGVQDYTVTEGENLAFDVDADDPDGDAVTLGMSELPEGASFDTSTGAFDWTPDHSQAGVYPVTVTATDEHGAETSREIDLTVENDNRPPEIQEIPDKTVDEGQPLSFTVQVDDPDPGEDPNAQAEGVPEGATYDPETGEFSWEPDFSQDGEYEVTFTATDPLGAQDTEGVNITVIDRPVMAENLAADEKYKSIQAAVDEASSGDTILVYPGTWREEVTVHVDGITICGANDARTGCGDDSSAVTLRPDDGYGILVDADGVTLRGMTILADGTRDDGSTYGIDVPTSVLVTGLTVEEMILEPANASETAENAIRGRLANALIQGNEMSGWATAVFLRPYGQDNTIADNQITAVGTGVSTWSPGTQIIGNTISGAGLQAIDITTVASDATTSADGNVLRDNDLGLSGKALRVRGDVTDTVIDARLNQWGVDDHRLIEERIDDQGTGNTVQFIPFRTTGGDIEPGLVRIQERPDAAFLGVQAAIDAALPGETVLVPASQNTAHPTPRPEAITVATEDVTVCGSVAGGPACADELTEGHFELSASEWAEAPGDGAGQAVLFDLDNNAGRSTSFYPADGTQVGDIESVAFDHFIESGTCGAGSPRVALWMDINGDGSRTGQANANETALVYSDAFQAGDCVTGEWARKDMLADDGDSRYVWNGTSYQTRQAFVDAVTAEIPGHQVDSVNIQWDTGDGQIYIDDHTVDGALLGEPADVDCYFTAGTTCRWEGAADRAILHASGSATTVANLTAPGTGLEDLTLRWIGTPGQNVAGARIGADEARVIRTTIEVQGGGCSAEDITAGTCYEPARTFGILARDGPAGVEIVDSEIRADIEDERGEIGGTTGIRGILPAGTMEGNFLTGWASHGALVRGDGLTVEANSFFTNMVGLKVCDDYTTHVVKNEFVGSSAAIAITECGGGEEPVFNDNQLGLTNAIGLHVQSSVVAESFDATCNDWGVYNGLAVEERVQNDGTEVEVDQTPFTGGTAGGLECLDAPSAGFTFEPQDQITRLDTVEFTSQATDGSRPILVHEWDFGDGGFSLMENPSHSYDAVGTFEVRYRVTDLDGMIGTAIREIDVVNLAPELEDIEDVDVPHSTEITFDAEASDPEGDALTYSIQPLPEGATFDNETGEFTWTPAPTQDGIHDLTVTVADPYDEVTDLAQVTVRNQAPAFQDLPSNVAGNEELEISFPVVATDAEDDAVTLDASLPHENMTFEATGGEGTFTWTPAKGEAGTYDVTFTAKSIGDKVTTQVVEIAVGAFNTPPTLTVDAPSHARPDALLTVDASVTDPDSHQINWSVEAGPDVFSDSFSPESGFSTAWEWWVPQAREDPIGVMFTADDGVNTVSQTVEIIPLRAPNVGFFDPIELASGLETTEVIAGETIELRAQAGDEDGTVVTAESDGFSADGGTVGPTTRPNAFLWTAEATFPAGEHEVTFSVTDDDGLTSTTTQTIVAIENTPPAIDPIDDIEGNATGPQGLEVAVAANATDPDGRGIASYTWTIDGTDTVPGTQLLESFSVGVHTVELEVVDENGASATESFTVTVDDALFADEDLLGAEKNADGVYIVDATATVGEDLVLNISAADDLEQPAQGALITGDVYYTALASNEGNRAQVDSISRTTGADGNASIELDKDLLGRATAPGHHVIELTVTQESRTGAPDQAPETAELIIRYYVGPDGPQTQL